MCVVWDKFHGGPWHYGPRVGFFSFFLFLGYIFIGLVLELVYNGIIGPICSITTIVMHVIWLIYWLELSA